MSFLDKDIILDGTFSPAGKASAGKYNILNKARKIQKNAQKKFYKEFLFQNLDWDDSENEKEKKIYSFEDLRKTQTPKQRAKIKNDIKKYFKEQRGNKITSEKKIEKEKETHTTDIKLNINGDISIPKKKVIKLNINKKNNGFYLKGIVSPLNKCKYKYHNRHMNKLLELNKTKYISPKNNEPIYHPKLEYIYNKLKIGPYWKKISGRKEKLFDESGNSLDKYYNINNLNSTQYNYIDMEKQTQRDGIPINHNLRQRYEAKFSPINHKKENLKWKKTFNRPLISKSPFSRDNHDYRLKMILDHHKRKYFFTNYKPELDKMLSFEKCKSIPDFNKCISRKYLEKLARKKLIESNEMYYPKYNLVKERVKMMVVYNKNKDKKNKFKGIKSNELFNLIDNFEKIYGHKIKVVPNFEKMLARPQDETLPSFMKSLFNRMSPYLITDKTLKLNNFSNRDMHYDIYKGIQSVPQIKKNEDENCSSSESNFDNDLLNENENTNENNKENKEYIKKGIKVKKEIDSLIKKMNRLYYNFQNLSNYKI